MEREVKFSLVFRDMWQSAGKYVPRVDQLVKVAPAIIEMGCFARVETNGGGFEQVNLLFGENPNRAVREWTKPFHEAGIQTHMLDRALNGLRMSPVPADVRKLFYKVKHAQGTDITRTFCGLNDVRNIIPSIGYAHEAGMISQCSLCITFSPIHTVEYYVNMAKQLIEAGADEICIKDMAGIGRPVSLGKIVAGIKKIKNIPIQYHSHAGPGFNMASIFEYYKEALQEVLRLSEIWVNHPANAMIGVMKQAGFSKKLIAETVERFRAAAGDVPCSAYEIYCGICDVISIARQQETNARGLLLLEEKVAACVSKRWHELDMPGEIKY